MSKYLCKSISNGSKREQALIRRWWHEEHAARGRIVWEYYLNWWYADAIWFIEDDVTAVEEPGKKAREKFPLDGSRIVLCEAKKCLSPSLIGQALVHTELAKKFGANVLETVIFAERAPAEETVIIAEELGITVVVRPLE